MMGSWAASGFLQRWRAPGHYNGGEPGPVIHRELMGGLPAAALNSVALAPTALRGSLARRNDILHPGYSKEGAHGPFAIVLRPRIGSVLKHLGVVVSPPNLSAYTYSNFGNEQQQHGTNITAALPCQGVSSTWRAAL
jgi:hypothetical protein